MSELKMREEFEVWAIKDAASTDKALKFERGGEWYLGKDHQVMNLGWAAWQASRETLVIDLPSDTCIKINNYTPFEMRDFFEQSARRIGLKVSQ
jgi:hypothetical protein